MRFTWGHVWSEQGIEYLVVAIHLMVNRCRCCMVMNFHQHS